MYINAVWLCSCFLENPYLRQLRKISKEYSVGARPILEYLVAVDDDGTREEEKNISSIALFQFMDPKNNTHDYSSNFTEFEEAFFQYYIYALPALEEKDSGTSYTLILRMFLCKILETCATYVAYRQ